MNNSEILELLRRKDIEKGFRLQMNFLTNYLPFTVYQLPLEYERDYSF